jgi:choline dehydrogenase-like flavoprotein
MADDVMEAAAELGYRSRVDLNGESPIGYTIAQANNRNGARLSTNKAFISPILDRPNLFISMESTVNGKKLSWVSLGKSVYLFIYLLVVNLTTFSR